MTPEIPKNPEAMATIFRVIFDGEEPTMASATQAIGPCIGIFDVPTERFIERHEGGHWSAYTGFEQYDGADLFDLLGEISDGDGWCTLKAAEWGYRIGIAIAKLDAQP
jgi:hypothetical protein